MSLFKTNVPLAPYTNYNIGGPARYFFEAESIDELRRALQEARELGEPIFILGGGYNLLIGDNGFSGVVIHPAFKQLEILSDNQVRVGAGIAVSRLLDFCLEHELIGLEWAGGLPGSVGGAIWGNAGAYGGETKDSVLQVTSCKLSSNKLETRTRQQCEFGYRTSIFKKQATDEVIIDAVFQLEKGARAALHEAVESKKRHRQERHPLEYPNCGSVFKNVPVGSVPAATLKRFEHKVKHDPFPVLPTAVLIAAAELKGFKIGGAMVSSKHSNFIVNVGGATAADVKAVMVHIKETVKALFGVELEQEVIFVGD